MDFQFYEKLKEKAEYGLCKREEECKSSGMKDSQADFKKTPDMVGVIMNIRIRARDSWKSKLACSPKCNIITRTMM